MPSAFTRSSLLFQYTRIVATDKYKINQLHKLCSLYQHFLFLQLALFASEIRIYTHQTESLNDAENQFTKEEKQSKPSSDINEFEKIRVYQRRE